MRRIMPNAFILGFLAIGNPAGCSLSMDRYPLGDASGAASSAGVSSNGGTTNVAGGISAAAGGLVTGGSTNTSGAMASPTCDSNVAGIGFTNGDAGRLRIPGWDWVGIIGTGQSLSVGADPVTSTEQPYHNLKLSLGRATVPPWNASDDSLTMVPLTEPIRPPESGFPRPYPGNIWGETLHSAMGNEITFLVQCEASDVDFITAHTVVGESGQGISALRKQTSDSTGATGRAYAATVFEVDAISRLAKAAGKTYGVGAVVMTHGETDSGNSSYKNALIQLLADCDEELGQITGQTQRIPMYLSQQHGYPSGSDTQGQRPVADIAQWQLGVEHKDEFICVGPQYQYEANVNGDGIHLSAMGYQMLGEKNGQVFYERAVIGRDWQPLQPTSVSREGRAVIVHFNVPVPPLNWNESFDPPTIAEWVNGRGFELRIPGKYITISSVEIRSESVVITADSDLPSSGLLVGYALSSQGVQMKQASKAMRWGQLRDSDPFVGSTSKRLNPNYAVSFELPVP